MKTDYYFDEHNRFVISNIDKIIKSLSLKKVSTGTVEFIPDSDNISHQQRKYFFGVIAEGIWQFFRDKGNDVSKEDAVMFIKSQWLFTEKFNPISGRYQKNDISLSNSDKGLDKETFQEKKMLIQQWGDAIGCEIPDPNPNWKVYK